MAYQTGFRAHPTQRNQHSFVTRELPQPISDCGSPSLELVQGSVLPMWMGRRQCTNAGAIWWQWPRRKYRSAVHFLLLSQWAFSPKVSPQRSFPLRLAGALVSVSLLPFLSPRQPLPQASFCGIPFLQLQRTTVPTAGRVRVRIKVQVSSEIVIPQKLRTYGWQEKNPGKPAETNIYVYKYMLSKELNNDDV